MTLTATPVRSAADERPARAWIESPLGAVTIDATAEGVVALEFIDDGDVAGEFTSVRPDSLASDRSRSSEIAHRAAVELRAYLIDARNEFTVPLAARGTPFQRRVWEAMRAIPCGETVSYGELARRIGSPKASRAVGMACGRNPIPIILPCHRVIAADGSLHGFSAGLWRKKWLLEHERNCRSLIL